MIFICDYLRLNWEQRWEKAGPVPDKITPYKGSVHVAVNKNFAQFAISNATSLRLMNWLTRTDIPDELFFTTLNHNPHLRIPGSFTGMYKSFKWLNIIIFYTYI